MAVNKQKTKEQLRSDIATLTTENSRLVAANARLKDNNNRLRSERSSAEAEKKTLVKTVEELNNELQRLQITHSKSNIWAPLYLRKVEMYLTLTSGALSLSWVRADV